MKKFLKVFTSLCLVVVVACAVLLSGCAKKFNVNVAATEGGNVYKVGSESVSLKGDNEVEEGKNFRIAISADDGYYIEKVTLNGKNVDIAGWSSHTYHIYVLPKVKADAKVVVKFAVIEGTGNFTFNFVDNNGFTVDSVSYSIPKNVQFALFNKAGETSGDADLFFDTTGKGQLVVCLRNDTNSFNVKESDTTKIAEIKTKLDGIFTAEKGCTKL